MNESDSLVPRSRLLTMQIIAAALLLGVLIFLGIVLYLVFGQGQGQAMGDGDLPVVSLIAVLLLMTNAPLSYVVPRLQAQAALKQIAAGTWKAPPGADAADFGSDAGKLLAVRQTSMIIGLALLEGVAFLGCIAFMLEGQVFALAVVGVAYLLMLTQFPTEGRISAWIERQLAVLAETRVQTGQSSQQ